MTDNSLIKLKIDIEILEAETGSSGCQDCGRPYDLTEADVGSMWRHVKTDRLYHIVCTNHTYIEATMEPAIVYQACEPPGWRFVRPRAEFLDGRFVRARFKAPTP